MRDEFTRPTLILVGFMGTGKSAVAALLAERLQAPAIDLDAVIVATAGCSISEFFARNGEAAFRDLEAQVLQKVLGGGSTYSGSGCIVATGGGAVLRPANRELMLAAGLVIALTASAECIIERVRQDASRPLLQDNVQERVTALLTARKDAYRFAHLTIDTTELTPLEVTEIIIHKLQEQAAKA